MSNISALTTGITALSNLILVTPQSEIGYRPQKPGDDSGNNDPPSILFHYEGEQATALESDITDHYVEDNTAVQDHIALKPVIITTHGFVGELNNVTPSLLKYLKAAAEKLTVISSYTPGLSTTALIAYNEAFLAYQLAINAKDAAVAAVSSIANLFPGVNINGENVIGAGSPDFFNGGSGKISGNQNKQQTYFQQFYGYWFERRLFTVQTPWAIFRNMAIRNLRAIQDAETRVITDFEISFKMIRNAITADQSNFTKTATGRLVSQASSIVQDGSQSPTVASSFHGALVTAGMV